MAIASSVLPAVSSVNARFRRGSGWPGSSCRAQVNLKADPVNNQPVLGPLVKHFTYDGLGRLIRTLSPYPGPSEHNNILRAEHFYYDGVRRIQEVVGHPIKSLEGLTESEIYELLLLAWAEFGVGEQPPDIKTVSTKLEEAQLINSAAAIGHGEPGADAVPSRG